MKKVLAAFLAAAMVSSLAVSGIAYAEDDEKNAVEIDKEAFDSPQTQRARDFLDSVANRG